MSSELASKAVQDQSESESALAAGSQAIPLTRQITTQSAPLVIPEVQPEAHPLQPSTTRGSAPPFHNLASPTPVPPGQGPSVDSKPHAQAQTLASPPPLFLVSPVPSTYAPRPGVTISFPVVQLSMLKGRSEVVNCGRCGWTGFTETRTVATWKTHCCAAATCVLFWPLMCLPYVIPRCSDVEHDCARCGAMLAKYERKHKTTQVYQTCRA